MECNIKADIKELIKNGMKNGKRSAKGDLINIVQGIETLEKSIVLNKIK